MMAWLQMWDRNIPSEKHGFAGMLTVARKVEVVNGQLYQTPVITGELVKEEKVTDAIVDHAKIGVLRIHAKNLRALTLQFRKQGENYAELSLNNGEWVFDRSRTGEKITGAERTKIALTESVVCLLAEMKARN